MRVRGRLAWAAALLLACSPAPEYALSGEVAVELDAFSGRPDPTWTLTPPEVRELARRLRDLPSTDGPLAPPGRLGYRGFWIRPAQIGTEPAARLHVHDGLVLIVPPRGPNTLRRDVHGVEAWLVAQASRRGYARVIRR
jgi:hypothetical protein